MIYSSPVEHPEYDDEEIHLWLDEMVKSWEHEVFGTQFDPEGAALCGHDLAAHWEQTEDGDTYYVEPAKERPGVSSLVDLLNHPSVCEECKTRASVYYDVVDEVDLWAKTALLDECGACGETMTVEILGVKGNGSVQRRHVCLPEYHFVTEDEVAIPEEVE